MQVALSFYLFLSLSPFLAYSSVVAISCGLSSPTVSLFAIIVGFLSILLARSLLRYSLLRASLFSGASVGASQIEYVWPVKADWETG